MNEYLEIIKTSIYFFPVIAFIFTVPYILYQYHKYGSIYYLRVIIVYSFILYLMTAYFLVILPLPTIEEVSRLTTPRMQLIPFSFINDFIRETSLSISDVNTYLKALLEPCFYVVAYNILLCLPFGVYLHYYFQKDLKKTILYTFLLSLFFELTQLSGLYFIYPRGYRLFDVDDLILNTLGGILGYYVGSLFIKFLPNRNKIDDRAYELGQRVSFLKRFVAFNIDFILYIIMSCIISMFTNNNHYYQLIEMIVYYILIPTIYSGKTLAYSFVNLKIETNSNFPKRQIIIRQSIWLTEMFVIPYLLFRLSINLLLAHLYILVILIVIFTVIYYLLLLICIIRKKNLICDKISKTTIISTIHKKV